MPSFQKIAFFSYYQLSYFGTKSNLIWTPARIGGIHAGDFLGVRLLVDTGASFTIIAKPILENLGYNLISPSRYQIITTGKGKTPRSPVIAVSWFNCVGQVVKGFQVIGYNIPQELGVDGVVGIDFLHHFRAIISVGESRIYFGQIC